MEDDSSFNVENWKETQYWLCWLLFDGKKTTSENINTLYLQLQDHKPKDYYL